MAKLEKSSLESVLKDIKKRYGENVVNVGVESLEVDGILSLGSPSLDFCIYGGIPEGRIVEFSGAEGSGKTTNAFLAAASYQREEVKRNPDNPRAIILLDNEGTADPVWAKKMGYNMAADAEVPTIIIRPEGQSAEEIFDMALDMLKTGEVGLLIFDSIATLVPQQIVEESMEKQQMGGIAKALTRFANTAIGVLRKYKATLIGINQVRENISGYGDHLLTPGGRSWRHACSMRLMFKRGDFFDEDGNRLTKNAESPAGHIVEVAVLKTKVCKWDRKLGYMHLNYTKGVDILEDTLDVATHFGFIDNSTQGSFVILDPDTGEVMLDENSKEVKIRGRKNLKPYFEEHKDIWNKLYTKCYDKLRLKEDPNIVAFEQMLNMNVEEAFGVNFEALEQADSNYKYDVQEEL